VLLTIIGERKGITEIVKEEWGVFGQEARLNEEAAK
jgi:hypothetical protein